MQVIYEPKGKAGEYSELAINLYVGCRHECAYCYCPSILRKSLHDWAVNAHPIEGILQAIEKDARRLAAKGDLREIMFCFMSDPYQDKDSAALTRQSLLILEKYGLRAHILTKAGVRARADFDILQRNNWRFGSTICFLSEKMREQWELGAPDIASRIAAVKEAHAMGIRTWVSMEPVVDPQQAMQVIDELRGHVDLWKVGKLNYNKRVESRVDWLKFLNDARSALKGENYYIKKDLLAYDTAIQ